MNWYHTVAFRTDRAIAERYGMHIGELMKKVSKHRYRAIHRRTWDEVADDYGAKPFYCS